MKKWKPTRPPFVKFKKEEFLKAGKVAEFIYQTGEADFLREKSKAVPVSRIKSSEIQSKIKYLVDCLLKYRKLTGYGRGMTAVQVGIPERLSAIYMGQTVRNVKNNKKVSEKDIEVIINPIVTKKSRNLLKYPEGCMSLNPVIVPTVRPKWIEFEYYDMMGNKKNWEMKADTDVGKMMNRVFMHEIDHMEGIINIDIAKNPKEIILWSDPKFYERAKFEVVN